MTREEILTDLWAIILDRKRQSLAEENVSVASLDDLLKGNLEERMAARKKELEEYEHAQMSAKEEGPETIISFKADER
jgi:hypothetical protein